MWAQAGYSSRLSSGLCTTSGENLAMHSGFSEPAIRTDSMKAALEAQAHGLTGAGAFASSNEVGRKSSYCREYTQDGP